MEAFPLAWPDGWKRTRPDLRSRNYLFKQSFAVARDSLMHELKLLGADKVVLSTNVPIRRDGLPYADMREPKDPGVAVYFEYRKRPMCFACDRYVLVRENIRAIALTIEAIRGIERWGASDMMERAFRGFAALPEKASTPWREVLGCGATRDFAVVEDCFKALAHKHHPDKGGDPGKFRDLVEARDAARRELCGAAV